MRKVKGLHETVHDMNNQPKINVPKRRKKVEPKPPKPISLAQATARARGRAFRSARGVAEDRRMYETELLRLQGEQDKITRGLQGPSPSLEERIALLKSLLK